MAAPTHRMGLQRRPPGRLPQVAGICSLSACKYGLSSRTFARCATTRSPRWWRASPTARLPLLLDLRGGPAHDDAVRGPFSCPVELALELLGGKWRVVILAYIKQGG